MQLRTVSAREGLLWVQSGFRRLALQPWAALLMIVTYIVVTGFVSALPIVGLVFPLFVVQFGTLGFMQASRQVAQKQPLWPTVLLTGFRSGPQALRSMVILGVLYTLAVILVLGVGSLFDGGAMLRLLLLGDKPPASAIADGSLRLGAIAATLAYIPVSLASGSPAAGGLARHAAGQGAVFQLRAVRAQHQGVCALCGAMVAALSQPAHAHHARRQPARRQ
jgi:hypothetical protein